MDGNRAASSYWRKCTGTDVISHWLAGSRLALRLGALAICLTSSHAVLAVDTLPLARGERGASFGDEIASKDARQVANRVLASGDSRGMPFIIVDKRNAKAFLFDARGMLHGATAVLLGRARGDVSPIGIGNRKLADIAPQERITPAGRFVAALGHDLGEKDILWVDYDAAISLHRVFTGKPSERRLQRLATATPLDNRVSYGCINVPVKFYDEIVRPAFNATNGIVYVLPEVKSIDDVFSSLALSGR